MVEILGITMDEAPKENLVKEKIKPQKK